MVRRVFIQVFFLCNQAKDFYRDVLLTHNTVLFKGKARNVKKNSATD